jgi:PTS system mannose-specific IIB component/fructoselysine and glucoselysine-specific PTS system IIB component
MAVDLFRIDDRLIHGQVVVGWGQPLDLAFLVLIDDDVAASDWEQDLYRMGVPPEMEIHFRSVEQGAAELPVFQARAEHGMVLTADIATMRRLAARAAVPRVNVGGIHHRTGRKPKLRYVFLSAEEEQGLRALAEAGVEVTAQDVPSAAPVPLDQLLASTGGR